MTVGAVLAAGGSGQRLGPGIPKALRPVAGESLLVHAVRALAGCADLAVLVIVVPAGHEQEVRAELLTSGLLPGNPTALSIPAPSNTPLSRWSIVEGGPTRRDSVAAGLAALAPDVDLVLVHDAARPAISGELLDRVIRALRAGATAVVPVIPVVDSLRRADPTGSHTLDRTGVFAVQTPQGFARAVLERAHREVSAEATDDAGLVELLGERVAVVDGDPEAFKVTTPADLDRLEALLARRKAAAVAW